MSAASGDRRRPPTPASSPLADVVLQLLGREKGHPVPYKQLRRDIARQVDNQPDGVVRALLAQLVEREAVIDLGGGEYFLADILVAAEQRICEVMAAYHATYPYERGMPAGEIKKRFSKGKTLNARRNIDPRLFELAMGRCRRRGLVGDNAEGLRLAVFAPTAAQIAEIARVDRAVLDYVGRHRYQMIDLTRMSADLGIDPHRAKSVVGRLQKSKDLVCYGEGRYIEAVVLAQLRATIVAELGRVQRLTMREIKQLLDIPRNAIILLLEGMDAAGITCRDGEYRRLAEIDEEAENGP